MQWAVGPCKSMISILASRLCPRVAKVLSALRAEDMTSIIRSDGLQVSRAQGALIEASPVRLRCRCRRVQEASMPKCVSAEQHEDVLTPRQTQERKVRRTRQLRALPHRDRASLPKQDRAEEDGNGQMEARKHACTERSHRSVAPEIDHVHAKFVSRDLPRSSRQLRACLSL